MERKRFSEERRRFGYRRLYILLRREGRLLNKKRLQRIYQERAADSAPPQRSQTRLGPAAPMAAADRPNTCWSLDFVHDQVTDGRRFRVLAVVDNCTRECLALIGDTSISGVRVARELDRTITLSGRPATVTADNGNRRPVMAARRRVLWGAHTGPW